MHVTAIIAAGGRGQRLGGARPKQLLAIGGRAILERSVAAFLAHPAVDDVIVALPADLAGDPPAYLRATSKPLRIVAGGARRQDSVANAFRAVGERADVIVIHDAARPFASAALIARTIAAAAETGAALAALPARDTVKQGDGRASVARRRCRASRSSSRRRRRRSAATCCATRSRSAIRARTRPTRRRWPSARDTPSGSSRARRRTSRSRRRTISSSRRRYCGIGCGLRRTEHPHPQSESALPARTGRAGIGYDLHRLVEGRPLILGGVTIPFERGLLGHSDADAVCHAITDAILGAAGAGDIGRHFPDTDPAWKDASSIDLLRRAAAIVRRARLRGRQRRRDGHRRAPEARAVRRRDARERRRARSASRRIASASRARPTKASAPSAAARRSPCTRSRCSEQHVTSGSRSSQCRAA